MQINKQVKIPSCSLIVRLKDLISESIANTNNKVVEKFTTDNYNVIIAKHEMQRKKKYKYFNTFEREEVYLEGKEYGDYMVNRFYIEN